MKKIHMLYFTLLLLLISIYTCKGFANAEIREFQIINLYDETIEMNAGDTGRFVPVESGENEVVKYEYSTFDDEVLEINEDGTFEALQPSTTSVSIEGYDKDNEMVYHAWFNAKINLDMNDVTLKKSSDDIFLYEYQSDDWQIDKDDYQYIYLSSKYDLSEATFTMDSFSSSNAKMNVKGSLHGETIYLSFKKEGSTVLTFVINGKTFTYHLHVYKIKCKKSYLLLSKNQKHSLKITGYSKKKYYKSSNKRVATITSKGVIRAKKNGTAIITVKAGAGYVGLVVNVVSKKKQKVVLRAEKIARTSNYSQEKRMSEGYYDCSSLVWKAYSKYGTTFGNKSYAPVAADIAKWCSSHKKIIKGGLSQKNIDKKKIRPGDLMFKTSDSKERYKGIYHVEMFTGYYIRYFYGKSPVLGYCWANRSDDYYGAEGQYAGRP